MAAAAAAATGEAAAGAAAAGCHFLFRAIHRIAKSNDVGDICRF